MEGITNATRGTVPKYLLIVLAIVYGVSCRLSYVKKTNIRKGTKKGQSQF